jgi:hypothetical protein
VPTHVVVVSQTTVRRFAGPRMPRSESARSLTLLTASPGNRCGAASPEPAIEAEREGSGGAIAGCRVAAGFGRCRRARQVGGIAVVAPIFDSPAARHTHCTSNDPPTARRAPHPDGVNPPVMIANSPARPGCSWCDGDGPRSSCHGDCRAPCVSMSLSMRDLEEKHQQGHKHTVTAAAQRRMMPAG